MTHPIIYSSSAKFLQPHRLRPAQCTIAQCTTCIHLTSLQLVYVIDLGGFTRIIDANLLCVYQWSREVWWSYGGVVVYVSLHLHSTVQLASPGFESRPRPYTHRAVRGAADLTVITVQLKNKTLGPGGRPEKNLMNNLFFVLPSL